MERAVDEQNDQQHNNNNNMLLSFHEPPSVMSHHGTHGMPSAERPGRPTWHLGTKPTEPDMGSIHRSKKHQVVYYKSCLLPMGALSGDL